MTEHAIAVGNHPSARQSIIRESAPAGTAAAGIPRSPVKELKALFDCRFIIHLFIFLKIMNAIAVRRRMRMFYYGEYKNSEGVRLQQFLIFFLVAAP